MCNSCVKNHRVWKFSACLKTCAYICFLLLSFIYNFVSGGYQFPNGARGNVAMELGGAGEIEDGRGDVDTVSLEKLQMEAKEV